MDNDFIKLLLSEQYNSTLQLPDPALVQYYIDLENRIIWLDGEVEDTNLDIVSKIINWNREDKGKSINERKPIKIYVNSVGGSLDIADTLVSVINISKTPVYGVALSMVASAASLIYLSCHKRFALPNAYFILHKGSMQNLGGNYNEIQAAMEDYKVQIERMEKFYIDNTSYPEEVIKEKIKSDWYIHCDEAMKYNIVTDLIENIEILL